MPDKLEICYTWSFVLAIVYVRKCVDIGGKGKKGIRVTRNVPSVHELLEKWATRPSDEAAKGKILRDSVVQRTSAKTVANCWGVTPLSRFTAQKPSVCIPSPLLARLNWERRPERYL